MAWLPRSGETRTLSHIAGRLTNAKTNQQAVVTASQAAQAKIDVIKAVIQAKLHARISACKIEFVDLPVLYMPADRPDPTNYKGPRLQASTAFTANLVNASIQGLTYVTQDPVLEGLRKDAIDSLTKVGVKNVAWVGDDFASKHGGVHCASHSIRVCRFRSRP